MAYCGSADGKDVFAYVTASGSAYVQDREVKLSGKADEIFRIACADLDRDNKVDMVAVGSRGTVTAASVGSVKGSLNWSKSYNRDWRYQR